MENRYDKYKDSGIAWIGEIPEHWEVIKIKNAFNIISGATPKTDNMAYWDGEITWITPADYNTEDKIISSGKRNITLAGLNSCGTSIVPEGSIIFSKRAPIGLVAINVVPLCTNQGCISCIPKPSVNTKYFYYLMSVLTEWFELFGSGTTFKELSTNNFANFILSQPLILEQQSIAAYLDQKCGEIDELITLQEEMITKLQSYKQSVITEAVTKGLDKNVPLKDSGVEWIGEIPEHWGSRRIKTFSLVKRGASPRPIDDPKYFDENGEFAWVRIADVSASGKYLECTTQKLSKLGSSLSVKRYPGDIFISIAGTVGKPIITNIKCCIHDGFVYFPNMKGISVEYLYYVFLSGQPYLGLGKMGTQLNLNTETIGNIYIPYPNIVEQTKIVYFLCQKCGEIDELISIKQQKIEKLKEYKKSLIFECVTGKRKVS